MLVFHLLVLMRFDKTSLVLSWFITFYGIVGFFYINNPIQVLFGYNTLLPCIFGWLIGSEFEKRYKSNSSLFLLIFVIACGGVFLDILINFPWG